MYRIKHVPTGLYYKPGRSNLGVLGKVYQTKNCILSHSDDTIIVAVRSNSKIIKKTEGKIEWKPMYGDSSRVVAYIPKEEFIKEHI